MQIAARESNGKWEEKKTLQLCGREKERANKRKREKLMEKTFQDIVVNLY